MIINAGPYRRSKLPVLNSSYPQNVSVTYNYNGKTTATFNVVITTPGKPVQYTYEWYVDGTKVNDANGASYTREITTECINVPVYCKVYNKAGFVKSKTATLTATCNDLMLINIKPQSVISVSGSGYSQQTDYLQLKSMLNVPCNLSTTMIDMTAFKTLTGVFDYWSNSTNGFFWRIYNSSGVAVKSSNIGFGDQDTYTKKTHSIDVSDLSGNHYIYFQRDATSSGAYLGIRSLKLVS